jgi:hypothetical protein
VPPYSIREEWSCNTFVALVLLQSASVCAGSENPPLMRFILKCAPLPFVPCASSLGSKLPDGSSLPQLEHGPPSWFRTTSTVYSAQRLAGLLRPATGSGVRYVSMVGKPVDNRSYLQDCQPSPRNAVHTLRRIPLVCSRTASLQPLPSCCYLPLHTT